MKLRNDFSDETRALFCFETTCWNCGRPNPELHHILGRVSNSPLNAYPLCQEHCHSKHIEMKSSDNISKFLSETISFLVKNNYRFNEGDIKFYQKYKHCYE